MNKDAYLSKIRHALWIIPKDKREEILREIESDITERLEKEEFEEIIRDMPTPAELKKEYISLYGISTIAKIAISIIALLISPFTIPVLPVAGTVFSIAPAFLLVLGIYIIHISQSYGKGAALPTSTSAAALRFALVVYISMIYPLESGTVIAEGVTSIIIAIIPLLTSKK